MRPGCGRELTAEASVTRGYGRTCARRITAAAADADLSAFHGWQVDKATEAIEQGAVVPLSREGVFAVISSDGVTVYVVDATEQSCTCKAAANGHRCWHLAAVAIVSAAALIRRPARPASAPAATAEITIGCGEDTICADCECTLPAGAPAWPDDDGRPSCADCTARADREPEIVRARGEHERAA